MDKDHQNQLDKNSQQIDPDYVGSEDSQSPDEQQNSKEIQQIQDEQDLNQQSEESPPVEAAIKSMNFRQKRGSKMKDLMKGKIQKDQFWERNDVYFGGDLRGKDQDQHQSQYQASSSGRDQFDSDFDLTDSYPGKRGRKKGQKVKKKVNREGSGRPRGRPRKIKQQSDRQEEHQQQNSQKICQKQQKKKKIYKQIPLKPNDKQKRSTTKSKRKDNKPNNRTRISQNHLDKIDLKIKIFLLYQNWILLILIITTLNVCIKDQIMYIKKDFNVLQDWLVLLNVYNYYFWFQGYPCETLMQNHQTLKIFFSLTQNIIPQCPVLTPSNQEFQIFAEYMEKIEKMYSSDYGMVKVIPPSGWKPRSTPYEEKLDNLIIKNPIEQNSEGKMGIYQFKHMALPSVSYTNFLKNYESREHFLHNKSPQQIETLFWKTLPYSAPVYGADLLETLMDQSAQSWNLNNLNTVLKQGLQKNLKGINSSYCYIGSWKALFCWHKEDMDLEAINFLHFGKSKFWYCIQTQDSHYLQKQGRKCFLTGFQTCPQYLRHKTSLINPYILKKNYPKIKISKMQQKPGQFIIAFSGAYHCGFNFGINVAQAVNFANIDWLYKLKKAKYCQCKKSTVRMSLQSVINKLVLSDDYKNNQVVLQLKKQIQQTEIHRKSQHNEEDDVDQYQPQKQQKINKTKKIAKKPKQKAVKSSNKKQTKTPKPKTDKIIQIQCDNCDRWHSLPSNKKHLAKQQQFYCSYLDKQCTEVVQKAQKNQHQQYQAQAQQQLYLQEQNMQQEDMNDDLNKPILP